MEESEKAQALGHRLQFGSSGICSLVSSESLGFSVSHEAVFLATIKLWELATRTCPHDVSKTISSYLYLCHSHTHQPQAKNTKSLTISQLACDNITRKLCDAWSYRL